MTTHLTDSRRITLIRWCRTQWLHPFWLVQLLTTGFLSITTTLKMTLKQLFSPTRSTKIQKSLNTCSRNRWSLWWWQLSKIQWWCSKWWVVWVEWTKWAAWAVACSEINFIFLQLLKIKQFFLWWKSEANKNDLQSYPDWWFFNFISNIKTNILKWEANLNYYYSEPWKSYLKH